MKNSKLKILLINFLSDRTNLTIFQCVLYFVIGYIMGQYLTWDKMIIMFIVLFGIQFITRTKAVADGIMFGHMMKESKMKANDIIEHMKKNIDKINDNKDLN